MLKNDGHLKRLETFRKGLEQCASAQIDPEVASLITRMANNTKKLEAEL